MGVQTIATYEWFQMGFLNHNVTGWPISHVDLDGILVKGDPLGNWRLGQKQPIYEQKARFKVNHWHVGLCGEQKRQVNLSAQLGSPDPPTYSPSYLTIHRSVRPSINLLLDLFIYISTNLFVCLSTLYTLSTLSFYLAVYVYLNLSIYLSICLSICLSIYLWVCVCVCGYMMLYVSVSVGFKSLSIYAPTCLYLFLSIPLCS